MGMFEGKKVLVTGGSRGIGRAVCLAFAREGASVAFVYHSRGDMAESLVREMGGGIAVQADLRDPESAGRAVDSAAAQLGGLDILVNNAGFLKKSNLDELTPGLYFNTINASLTAAFFCTKAALAYLGSGSSVVNMTSQAAFTGSIGGSAYAAAKGGILGFTYSMAKELGPRGIRVNAIAPGRIDTDMIAYGSPERRQEWIREVPLGGIGETEDIAQAVLFLCSDGAKYITGAKLNVNGGMLMG